MSRIYTIHGVKEEYNKGGRVPCMDSEGNIFPSAAELARYHKSSPATIFGAEYIRPVKSKLLGKPICTSPIYTDVNVIFDTDQTRLVEDLSKYETRFSDYIFKKIPAMPHADGTYSLAQKLPDGDWVFDRGYWE